MKCAITRMERMLSWYQERDGLRKIFGMLLAALAISLSSMSFAGERMLLVFSSSGTAEDPESGHEFDELSQGS